MWSKSKDTDKGGGPTAGYGPPYSTARDSRRRKNPGRRFAQIIKLKPECVKQYKEAHAAVWPEVLKQIKASNIEDCRLTVLLSFKFVMPTFRSCKGSVWSHSGEQQ